MKTAVQNLIPELEKNTLDQAAKNGMTVEQMAACRLMTNCKAVKSHPAFAAIASDRAASLAFFDRIALIPESDKGSCYVSDEMLVAALLA
jgi:hypothetical protein